jgi:hypothetical protein
VQTANLDENIAENVQKIQSDARPITAYATYFYFKKCNMHQSDVSDLCKLQF